MQHKIFRKTMLRLGLMVVGVSLSATPAQGKSFITIQPNAAAPSDTAYIITVSWEDGFASSVSATGNMDDKTLLTNSSTTVPSGALAGATIRFANNNNDGVDQNSTTTNTTTNFQWDGTDGTSAAAGSPAAESVLLTFSGLGSFMSVAETSPLVYGTGVQGVTSLASHLGIENTALHSSTLGSPFGVRLRNEASDGFGLMMRVDRQLFPQNGLAIISMPYATGSGFTSMFNPGTYTVTQGALGDTELVVTTDPNYVPKVFTAEIAVEQPALTDIANGGTRDFGSVTVGSNTSLEFTIRNTGTGNLNLTGTAPDYVTVSGEHASDFTVTAQPATSVASGSTTNFTVAFAPSATGARNALLTIVNNNTIGDGGSYTINISGTGQNSGAPTFATWSGGADADVDSNGDGVDNGVAWALGAANVNENAIGLLPTLDNSTDPDFFIFNFNRSDDANDDTSTTISVEYGSNLSDDWTTAVASEDVVITETPGSPTDAIQVKIRRSLAVGSKLFARLKVVVTP